jgi:hypothetical protein
VKHFACITIISQVFTMHHHHVTCLLFTCITIICCIVITMQIAKQYLNVWLSLLWLQYVIRCLMETSWTKKIQRLLDVWTKLESFSWKKHDDYHGDYNTTYDGDACKQKTCYFTLHYHHITCFYYASPSYHMSFYHASPSFYLLPLSLITVISVQQNSTLFS